MIIFGTRGVKSTLSKGVFNCPQCESSQDYKHKKVTKYFTIYFIPLIPLGSAGEYVECVQCKGTFIPRVLDQDTAGSEAIQALYEKAMTHCMILIMLADGEIDANEKITVRDIINKFGYNDVTLDDLDVLIAEVQTKNEEISTYLKKVTPSLNEHGKETILKCALAVAGADGNIDSSELELIQKMAEAMEMSSSHIKGILSEVMNPQTFSNN